MTLKKISKFLDAKSLNTVDPWKSTKQCEEIPVRILNKNATVVAYEHDRLNEKQKNHIVA